ncbi:MAG: TetR/AcrR family transcriptional regulator [Bacteroidales bacterium]|nr:TetR/AcrR family transcriptional regulator [Bacteroidales bacterium]
MTDRLVNENMPPKSKEQFEIIRQDRRIAILEAALRLFGRDGYHGSSMASLAKEAGISKGLIYNYFSTKEEVLVEMVSMGLRRMVEYYNIEDKDITDEIMSQVIEKNFEMIEINPEFWSIYFAVILQPGIRDKAIRLAMEQVNKYNLKFAAYFQRKGFENPMQEAVFIGSIFDGVSLNFLYNSSYYDKYYAINRIKEILKIK